MKISLKSHQHGLVLITWLEIPTKQSDTGDIKHHKVNSIFHKFHFVFCHKINERQILVLHQPNVKSSISHYFHSMA